MIPPTRYLATSSAAVRTPISGEVGVDVGLVGHGGGVPVHPHDEQLTDLLLQGHTGDDPAKSRVAVVAVGRMRLTAEGERRTGAGGRGEESASGRAGGGPILIGVLLSLVAHGCAPPS